VLAAWAALFEWSPNARFEIEEIVEAGDRCVLRWVYRRADREGWPGHVRGSDLCPVRDGRVAEKLCYVQG